jgi:hypothetical protein
VTTGTVEPGFLSVGQDVAQTIALRAAGSGRLQRTILVHGPAGAGKDAFVDDLLALLLCRAPSPASRPCNACRGCRDARARTHPDLLMARSGRAELAASGRQLSDLPAAAMQIEAGALVEFIGVLESVVEGLRANGAPRLAMERAMLAWPVTGQDR